VTGVKQYELFERGVESDAAVLSDYLNDGARVPVRVAFTRNRVSMASVRFGHDSTDVRLHEAFLSAPKEVPAALRKYLNSRRRNAWSVVAAFARTIDAGSVDHAKRESDLRRVGRVYDLSAISRDINARFFNGRVKCSVGWGRRRPAKRRGKRGSSIRFGSWSPSTRTIRIHPLLDDERVPRDFVEYIVFHEMLHVVVPSHRSGGRRYDHSASFRTLEKTFPDLPGMKRVARKLVEKLV